jgi:hypothetical protein
MPNLLTLAISRIAYPVYCYRAIALSSLQRPRAETELTRLTQRIFVAFLWALAATTAGAVEKSTLSGYVRDTASNEELIGVSVFVKDLKVGSNSNNYGFYSLTLPSGTYRVQFRLLGYAVMDTTIDLSQNIRMDVGLATQPITVDSVVVTAEAPHENTRQAEMSSVSLNPAQMRTVPMLAGEQDILKAIQLTPGVQAVGEGNSGFYVRGGGADQNLILLDEATVYSSSHLLGFFSVFNSDAIKDAKLIKGTASAEYGGRLSSVLDVKMKEGNSRELRAAGGIGLVSSRLAIEAPIAQDKSSFILTGRRTYFDLFLKASSDEAIRKTRLYFYDLNAKTNYRLGPNDRLFLSGYFGQDVLGYKGEFEVDWGNATGTARWNHIFNSRLFSNSSFMYSHYDYLVGITNGDELIEIRSSIRDVSLKQDFQFFVDSRNTMKFGFQSTYHTFVPGEISATHSSINELRIKRKYAIESAVYLDHEWSATQRLTFDAGLRYSGFALLGPADVFTFDQDGDPIDTTHFASGALVKYYGRLEPRLTTRYTLTDQSSLKASFTKNAQYLHLLSNSTTTTPFDLWHPSTSIVKPGDAYQYTVGYFRDFGEETYETSLELYYKDLRNQVDYKNGADVFFNELVESQLVFGKARTYGLELYAKKKRGRLTGWISYTLSRAQEKFDAINDGEWFRARQDRIHDLEVIGTYELSRHWTFGFDWVYYTGNAVTFPSGKYIVDHNVVNLYTERNGYRMPAYHRLDLGFTWAGRRSSWNFSLYNAYGRKNTYAIDFRKSESDPKRTDAVRIALFAFFPSVTYDLLF